MGTRNVDVAIIGAGTAGLNARREALKNGAKSVVLIENGPYGTTCARVGCMPSKLLIHPANVVHEAKTAAKAGIHADLTVDQDEVLKRVRAERDRFVGFIVKSTENIPENERMRGTARFLDDHTLDVDGEKVTFQKVVIATGSRNKSLPLFDNLWKTHPERILNNDNIFEIERFPNTLAVFGTGVIGLELGQALSRLGVQTSFFGKHGNFGGTTDPEVDKVIRSIMDEELDVKWDSETVQVNGTDDGVELVWTDGAGEHRDTFDYLLLTVGRAPNVENLDLHNTSLKLNKFGLPDIDFETGQAGDSHFFFAGDVTNERPLLHEASDEGRHAGANAARYPNVSRRERRVRMAVTFFDPNIATIGVPWSDLDHDNTVIGEVSYYDQGRSRVMQQNRGIVRIYASKEDGRMIGVEGIAPALEHMAHTLAWAIQSGMTVDQALTMPFYHPVTEEGIRTALQDAQSKLAKS